MRSRNGDSGNGNRLYFGDNLEILRSTVIPDGSVNLIYLDPPFNSQAQYNVLFQSPRNDGSAQAGAFLDTWRWGEEADISYDEIMRQGGSTAKFIDALKSALGESDTMAYLVMMAVRLDALQSKLKPTGTLYLHCDPTASHYLKILLDGIFGADRFANEIVWRRTTPKGLAFSRFATNHDVLLAYRKGPKATWNPRYLPYSDDYLARYNLIDEKTGRRFQGTSLLNPAKNRPNLTYAFHGHTRVWRWTKERMRQAEADNRIYLPAGGGVPREKRFLDEQEGVPVSSVWTDIPAVNAMADERIGYPTQKPLALLERIVTASSNPGDTILDPFCGCGTTIEAAQKTGRHWIGIDIAIHAIKVIEARLAEQFPGLKYKVEGIPRDFASAERLAKDDKYQFQWWANYLFNPHALREQKKGADRGVDGDVFFPNGPGRPWGRMITSVKGGENVNPAMVREFAGTINTENAEMGLFICLHKPTRDMERAAAVGIAKTVHGTIPKLQIVAIEEFFQGKLPKLPPLEHLPSAAFSTAKRRPSLSGRVADPDQPELPLSFVGGKGKQSDVLHLNLNMVRESEHAAAQSAAPIVSKKPKRHRPTELRKQPQFMLPISGAGRTKELPLNEPLLFPQRATAKRRAR